MLTLKKFLWLIVILVIASSVTSCFHFKQLTFVFTSSNGNFYEVIHFNHKGEPISKQHLNFKYIETENKMPANMYSIKYQYSIKNLVNGGQNDNWTVYNYSKSGLGDAGKAIKKTDYFAGFRYFLASEQANVIEANVKTAKENGSLRDTIVNDKPFAYTQFKENKTLKFGDKEYTTAEYWVTRQHGAVAIKLVQANGEYTIWRLML